MFSNSTKKQLSHFYKSIWFFPTVLAVIVLLLTICKISGTSMGVYYQYFYGDKKDPALIVGKPRSIRSDEWVVNTQMTIAQKNNHFARINQNIGDGEDTAVILDAPYKSWSEIFRPHNWAFFILPLEQAFAFKWWIMGYLLVISCYFFILALMPKKRLLATLLSLALFFSAFIQWWYQYITMAPIYYSLFAGLIVIHISRATTRKQRVVLGSTLAYTLVCFALVQYPPFQIPCALAIAFFLLGYFIQKYKDELKNAVRPLATIGIALVVAGVLIGIFLKTESSVVHIISSTAYPGKRVVASGGFDIAHFLSGQYAFQFQFGTKAAFYHVMTPGYWNQSEASNFLLLVPFLLLPALYIHYRDKRTGSAIDYILLGCNIYIAIILGWLFVPHLSILGKLFFLDKVPLNRALIGIGLMNTVYLVVIANRLKDLKGRLLQRNYLMIYCGLILAIEFIIGLHVIHTYPGFVGHYRVVLLSLPVPIIVYLFLRKRFEWAFGVLLAFSFISTAGVNPLYRGMQVLTNNPLIHTIHSIASHESGKWIIEDGQLENMAIISGAPSLSGLYTYPQLNIWKPLDNGSQSALYNRYAHVTITLNRDTNNTTVLTSPTGDHFGVGLDACNSFLNRNNVAHAVTEVPLTSPCAHLEKTLSSPTRSFYIYHLGK